MLFMRKSPEKIFNEYSSKNKSQYFYFKIKTKSTASITTNQSNYSINKKKKNTKISFIHNTMSKSPIRVVNNYSATFNLNKNINTNNNKNENENYNDNIDDLYENILMIEGKRILKNLNEGLKITNEGKFIINTKKLLINNKNNILHNLFPKYKRNLKLIIQNSNDCIKIKRNKSIKNYHSRNKITNNYSTINLYSTLKKESKNSFLSKSTKSMLIKSNIKNSKKNIVNDKDNIINQIFSTMRINNIKKEKNKNNTNSKDYFNTIYKNNRTCSKISTIKLLHK